MLERGLHFHGVVTLGSFFKFCGLFFKMFIKFLLFGEADAEDALHGPYISMPEGSGWELLMTHKYMSDLMNWG